MTKTEWEVIFLETMYVMQQYDIPRNKKAKLKHPERRTTGNLKHNAFKGQWVEHNHYVIYMDENIAPYMPYTNEKWISPKWKGAKNPNENWWQKSVKSAIGYLALEVLSW